MSSFPLVFCNPPLDANRPAGGPVVTNASPQVLAVALRVELTRDPSQPFARAVFRGIDSSEPNREHAVDLLAPATTHRSVVALRLPPMGDAAPRRLQVEVTTPGTLCTIEVLSVTPCAS